MTTPSPKPSRLRATGIPVATAEQLSLLSEIVTTKICHDLAGLVSAFSNGAEILAETPREDGLHASSVALLGMSAEDASARLRLFRRLFGSCGSAPVPTQETAALMRGYLRGFEVTEEKGTLPDELSACAEKAALTVALVAHKAFPRKAEVRLAGERDTDGTLRLRVSAKGKIMMLDEEERAGLKRLGDGVAGTLSYKNLASWHLAFVAAREEARIEAHIGQTELEVAVALP
jgi:hypothetical protein